MRRILTLSIIFLLLAVGGYVVYRQFMAPTRILVVNALEAQQADFVLNNDSRHISVSCVDADQMTSLDGYDAIIFYARRIFLTDEQMAEVQRVASRGVPVFTKTLRTSDFVENHNLTDAQIDTLKQYFENDNRQNYRNGLRYLRHIATPRRWGDQQVELPVEVPKNMFYHRQYGQYFKTADELTAYLRHQGLYHEGRPTVAMISGITFPMEGNREHVDTLITMLTQRGMNVYPLTGMGKMRDRMLRQLQPDAVVYLPMGRIGNDTLIQWMQAKNVALFTPFPISASHDEWLDEHVPMSSGSKNARIVIPEIDGGIAPYCIATQNTDDRGYYRYTAEVERCEALAENVSRYLSLRTKPNGEKRIAIGYFRRPGKDALLASGMEVVPSMYNFLLRLRREGYRVDGLPATLDAFARDVHEAADRPLWAVKRNYEQWVKQVIPAAKYAEVTDRYGTPPDSIPMTAVRYGSVLLFLQPRPALGDDDFRFVHGVDVAPPHSYLAPYLYMQREFQADALVHFGTHGNLEFTPGRDAAMRREDWSQQLIGPVPHFYFYTTGNIGEAVIAKRRSHAVIMTYLTPPYAESGMRQKYNQLHQDIHKALNGQAMPSVKQRIVAEGLHRALGIDSIPGKALTRDELERIDTHIEELMDERMQGAYYVLGQPYPEEQLRQTCRAINDDPAEWPRLRSLLLASTQAEMDNMVRALSGGTVAPAPGGDPVMNDNVLPTGRNMFSINPDNTPDPQAWEDGRRLAEQTLAEYRRKHDGQWPRKVSYTIWAGEFIASGGATIAQALWMLGVEPERDSQGRIGQLRLVPAAELGRPRINVVVQVSGQLRDIADSRLKLITEAIQMASAAEGDSNFVHEGTLAQERELIERGVSPQQARELATLRVFGPVNNGYSTGMMNFIERSEKWQSADELTDQYLNNMCAAYGDERHWGLMQKELFAAALQQTDVLVQPRQSNTWGPLSLDHVYEFTGGLSMVVRRLTGREPDAMMADYRNPRRRRMQGLKEAIDIEARTTILNPNFIRERMKGDEGTAQMFGEVFRNIFGWNVTRPSALDPQLYDDLYRLYVEDGEGLGVRQFLEQKNPAAYQSMTETMLESARKGYWKPSGAQLAQMKQLNTQLTAQTAADRQALLLEKQGGAAAAEESPEAAPTTTVVTVLVLLLLLSLLIVWMRRKK
jgi:cobaltochelatase CobN